MKTDREMERERQREMKREIVRMYRHLNDTEYEIVRLLRRDDYDEQDKEVNIFLCPLLSQQQQEINEEDEVEEVVREDFTINIFKKNGILSCLIDLLDCHQDHEEEIEEIKRLRSLVGNLHHHIEEQSSLETTSVLESGKLLQDLVDLLLVRVASIHAALNMQKVQDELKELERRAPLAKKVLAKKGIENNIAEKHREFAEMRASQAEMLKQNPESIIQRMAEDMLALNMSYEAFGIPRGLEERVTFPLSERVGIVEGADSSRSFIIISAYSRKPSGAQGFLLFERFVMEPGKFQQTRQLFAALANDPRNNNLVLRMIDYAPKTEDSADGVLAQGIVALVEGNLSDASPQVKKKKNNLPQKKVKRHGPGKFSGNRR